MKKIAFLLITIVFFIFICSCISTMYSGITYSEEENVYYLTDFGGKVFKCKMINKKLYCVEIELEDID